MSAFLRIVNFSLSLDLMIMNILFNVYRYTLDVIFKLSRKIKDNAGSQLKMYDYFFLLFI